MTRPAVRALALACAIAAAAPLAARDWIVDSSAPAGGDGSAAAPFKRLASVEQASAPGDAIVLRGGGPPYAEGLILKEAQTLSAAEGERPIIANPNGEGITLASATTISGIGVVAHAQGAAIWGEGVGDVTLNDVKVDLAGEASALVLHNPRGTISARGIVTGNGSGPAILIAGGDGAVAFDAFTVTRRSGGAVSIANRAGGNVTFTNGSVLTISAGAGEGVVLTANHGEIVFADPVRLTTSGDVAVRISGGDATVELPDLHVSAGTGSLAHAVAVDGSTGRVVIGGSIRNAAQRGVSLTKSSNVTLLNLKVEKAASADGTGCGPASAEGAHLQCSAAVYLSEVAEILLQGVRINETSQMGITGDAVHGLQVVKTEITGSGDELDESGVHLRNVTGHVLFADTRVRGSEARQLAIVNDTGDATIEIRGCDIGGSKAPSGQQGLLLSAHGDARVRLLIDGTTISDNFSNGVHVTAAGKAEVDAVITKSKFAGNAAAILFAPAEDAALEWRIAENTVTGSTGVAMSVHSTSKGTVRGSIERNTIGIKGKSGSGASCGGGCGAIALTALSRGTFDAAVTDNVIQQVDSGIRVRGGDNAEMRVRVTGNEILEPAVADAGPAIAVQAGMRPNDTAAVCADVGGAGELANRVSGSWNPSGGGAAIQFVQRVPRASLAIAGYAGDRSAAANAARFVATRNQGAAAAADVKGELTLADSCVITQGEY